MSQSLRLRQLIKSASKGAGAQSLQALREIGDLLQTDQYTNSSIILEIWPVLQAHLQGSRIPQTLDADELPLPVQMAHASLCVLALGIDHQFPQFFKRFTDAWKNSIWPWTLFFINQVISNSPSFEQEATLKIVVSICGGFTLKARKSLLIKDLRRTPDYIPTVVRLWFHCARNLTDVIHDVLSIVTGLLPDSPLDRQGEGMEIIGELNNYPVGEASSLLLDTIITAVESDQICAETLYWSLNLFLGFTMDLSKFSILSEHILAKRSIPVVILVLSQLGSLHPPVVPAADADNLLGAIEICFSHLLHVFENINPKLRLQLLPTEITREERIQWVAQALDHKLIPVMRRLIIFLVNAGFNREELYERSMALMEVSFYAEQLYISLAQYLAYDTPRRLISRSLRNLGPFPEEPLILVEPCERFRVMTGIAMQRWSVFMAEPRPICSGPECPSPTLYVTQAAPCAGCNVAFYCSRACQEQHWVVGHKEYCAILRSRPRAPGYPGELTSIDKAFDKWLQMVPQEAQKILDPSLPPRPKRKHPRFVDDEPISEISPPSPKDDSHVQETTPLDADTGLVTPPTTSHFTKSWADMVDDDDEFDDPLPEFPPLRHHQIQTTLPPLSPKESDTDSPHGEETSSVDTNASTPGPLTPASSPKTLPKTTSNTKRADNFWRSSSLSWADLAEEEFDDSVRMFS